MPLRAFVMLALLVWTAGVRAQRLDIAPPPDRFVGPGEFVTLVFRLTAAEALEVEVAAETERGWTIVRQPGSVRLEPGRSAPVVATVEVPADAPALSEGRVRLTVVGPGVRIERSVLLMVTERVELTIDAPREVTLGTGDLIVRVTNRGNAPDDATIELLRGDAVVARRSLRVAVGEAVDLALPLADAGAHVVALTSARGVQARRSVTVVAFGVPAPPPFLLEIDVTAVVATDAAPRATFSVAGPLSDFAALDARFDAPGWRRSYASVTFEHGSLRVGGGWRDPFALGLPSGFGVAGTFGRDDWGLAAAAGHVADERFAGVVAGTWRGDGWTVAGGLGVAEGAPLLALRGERVDPATKVAAQLGWDRAGWSVALRGEVVDPGGVTGLEAAVRGLGSDRPRADLGVRYRAGDDVLYADAGWDPGAASAWAGRIGGAVALPVRLPGTVRLGVQVGSRESFVQATHRLTLDGGWRATTAVGVRDDADGLGVTFDLGWLRATADPFAVDLRLAYRPAVGLADARAGLRYQLERGPWTAQLGGNWEVADRALAGSASATWRHGGWRAEAEASLGFGWDAAPGDRWNASFAITAAHATPVAVPAAVSETFGGRRVGTLAGRVVVVRDGAEGAPAVLEGVAGVVVEVGRYRVVTDRDGAFALTLPPGPHPLALVAATVPVSLRLLDPVRSEVEVRLRETTVVTWRAVPTTVLTGRVLQDADGDGVADEPARGVAARLLLTDAEGLRRVLSSDADGAFVARGLVPGDVEVLLLDLPAGSALVGDARRAVRLAAGEAAAVEFLVRPVAAAARSFAAQALRVRDVAPEVDRVPPASAPVVRVTVQGDARSVVVASAAGEVALARVGDGWLGRVPVPPDAADGVWPFTIVVRGEDGEATRRGQLLVDAEAPILLLAAAGPVRPGGTLGVTLTAFLELTEAVVASPFGGAVALRELEPGRWVGEVPVPGDAEDAVRELSASVTASDGRVLTAEARFRVLAP